LYDLRDLFEFVDGEEEKAALSEADKVLTDGYIKKILIEISHINANYSLHVGEIFVKVALVFELSVPAVVTQTGTKKFSLI
jgi:hypothetical protein